MTTTLRGVLEAAACSVLLVSGLSAEPVRLDTIEVGGFWKQQIKRITEKWLPHCVRQMEEGGRGQELLNLQAAARVLRGEDPGRKYTGAPWADAYVYNTVEASCLALAYEPGDDADLAKAQDFLRAKVEEWIPLILAAQAEDGYIHSFHVVNGHPRYSNVGWHEFYVMGYFLEMGVAHYRATAGKDRRLYDAAVRCADHLDATFGPTPKRTWRNGHAGLEYALCRLGRLVNEVEGNGRGDRYFALARYFLDHQHEGEPGSVYNQSEQPAAQMTEARGHAVRATYFYTALADLARHDQDAAYGAAVDSLWESAIQRKYYLTGGVGASHNGEAFDDDYKLPNSGYCESCAGCGMMFWADRMHRLHGRAHYHDVLERVVYNNLLGALELSGENFFYQNPLASATSRYPWHGCPCCVGNLPRALLGLKDQLYALDADGSTLRVNHYMDSKAQLTVDGRALTVRQQTEYPWQGRVVLTFEPETPCDLTVQLRIPDRTESKLYTATPDETGQYELTVGGEPKQVTVDGGYVCVRGQWRSGDKLTLDLPMPIQRLHCDDRVAANRGRVALQRGPLVYNVEQVDHEQNVEELRLPPEAELAAAWRDDLLGGVMTITSSEPQLLAIPNYARLNRGGWSQVWLVEDPARIVHNNPVRPDLEARKLDRVLIGVGQSEREHNLQGERTGSGMHLDLHWRHAGDGGWFSYDMQTEADCELLVTYWGSDVGNRSFDILVNGTKIAEQTLNNNRPGEFFDVVYPVPAELVAGHDSVTVSLQAHPGATAGGIFDIWMLKPAGAAITRTD